MSQALVEAAQQSVITAVTEAFRTHGSFWWIKAQLPVNTYMVTMRR